ncbi:hypothetical protein VNO77_03248 [Canavalia gladiata]|uniref:Uncharacterized protein n=1 Tax=Canavalia gladiata TaxID=3824 RepID=A0AAN9MV57_CANGL
MMAPWLWKILPCLVVRTYCPMSTNGASANKSEPSPLMDYSNQMATTLSQVSQKLREDQRKHVMIFPHGALLVMEALAFSSQIVKPGLMARDSISADHLVTSSHPS